MTTNPRASLLAGLRTGGVRSSSGAIPHTAAVGGSFNVPRFASHNRSAVFLEEDADELTEMPSQNVFANNHYGGNRTMPMTAAVDIPNNMFLQQQQSQSSQGLNPNSVPFSPGFMPGQPNQAQAQAFQLQMMQLELMKIQVFSTTTQFPQTDFL